MNAAAVELASGGSESAITVEESKRKHTTWLTAKPIGGIYTMSKWIPIRDKDLSKNERAVLRKAATLLKTKASVTVMFRGGVFEFEGDDVTKAEMLRRINAHFNKFHWVHAVTSPTTILAIEGVSVE